MLITDKLENTRCLQQEIKITNSPTPRDNQYLYRVSFMLIVYVCIYTYIYHRVQKCLVPPVFNPRVRISLVIKSSL